MHRYRYQRTHSAAAAATADPRTATATAIGLAHLGLCRAAVVARAWLQLLLGFKVVWLLAKVRLAPVLWLPLRGDPPYLAGWE
ncbi:hypothetical protein BX600DRAFT_475209 [Xylariales sp. PMI_506]|nr:hypothetical protein BX600DRAFT_475209 [Xylariales sp. PMI_506]